MTEDLSDDAAAAASLVRVKAPATIYDIAKLAGVNPSTVSRALSKPGRINSKTVERIEAAAKQLDYRLNPMARALPTGRTNMLGLLVADITNPMFFEVVRGAEREAALHGYTLLLAESQESGEREAETARRVTTSVDGLLLVATRLEDAQIRDIASTKPLVVINRRVQGLPAIVAELDPGIDQALEHLESLGHRSIAFLSGPTTSWMSHARWELLLAKAPARGMTVVAIGPGAPTLHGGRDLLERVVASGVTAVAAYNDLMGIGLMRAAQERGLRIPGDLSIVGFDDIFGSDFTSPQLSTVRTPLGRLGERGVRQLLRIADSGAGDRDSADAAPLLTEFVARGSTGPIS